MHCNKKSRGPFRLLAKLVKRIDAAVVAMNELFNALLDVSKLDAGVLSTDVTEFEIALLLKRIESTFADAAREKPPAPAIDIANGKLVIVIDDDALVLEGMGGMTRNWGCRVVAAATPGAALAGITSGERPDLVISNCRLANGQSGIAAIVELRQAFGAPVPALLISGDTAPERLREAQESGHHLLHKPVRPMKLRPC